MEVIVLSSLCVDEKGKDERWLGQPALNTDETRNRIYVPMW